MIHYIGDSLQSALNLINHSPLFIRIIIPGDSDEWYQQ